MKLRLPFEIKTKPNTLFKVGDKVCLIQTEFFRGDGVEAGVAVGTTGVIIQEPIWTDSPGDRAIIGWMGPGGWLYHVEFRDVHGDFLTMGPYHELELIKCCK